MESNFLIDLNNYIESHDNHSANRVVMEEIGRLIAKDKNDFREILESSGVVVPSNATDVEMIDLFIENAPKNRKLLIGASFWINHNNKISGIDGESELSDEGVKDTYKCMYSYFDCPMFEDEYYNSGGGVVTAIAGALKEGAVLTGKYKDANEKKKYLVTDTIAKQKEAKNQLLQSLLLSKQAEKSDTSKSKRTIIIASVIGGVVLIGILIYALTRKK
jgi:hypothetical protein